MMFDVVSLALAADQGRPGAGARASRPSSASRCCPTCRPLIEQGMPAEVGAWFGFAPAGMPPAGHRLDQSRGHQDFLAPDARDRFVQQGAAVPLGTPESFAQFIEAESASLRRHHQARGDQTGMMFVGFGLKTQRRRRAPSPRWAVHRTTSRINSFRCTKRHRQRFVNVSEIFKSLNILTNKFAFCTRHFRETLRGRKLKRRFDINPKMLDNNRAALGFPARPVANL